jgi:hypothetical protein
MPLFFLNVYNGFKFCLSSLEAVRIRVPIQNFKVFPLFTVASSRKTFPSAICVSTANTKVTDMFYKHLVTLNHILK